jgi:hypothetical protein
MFVVTSALQSTIPTEEAVRDSWDAPGRLTVYSGQNWRYCLQSQFRSRFQPPLSHIDLQNKILTESSMKKMSLRFVGFSGLVVLMFLATASFSWAQDQSKAIVVKATKHVLAPSLAKLASASAKAERLSSSALEPQIDTATRFDRDDEMNPRREEGLERDEEDAELDRGTQHWSSPMLAPDSVQQETVSAELATTPGQNFLGVGEGFSACSNYFGSPDPNGAVGPTQFVQWVNFCFAVFNKTNGSLEYGPAASNSLWKSLGGVCAANDNYDQIAQYDKLAGRWVMLMPVTVEPTTLCVAVSSTSDFVNSTWNLYSFPVPSREDPDYPKLGVWPDAYYVTYNQFNSNGFVGPAACALDRNDMLTGGTAATMQCFTNTGTKYGALLPGDLDGTTAPPTGSPNYFVNFDQNYQSLDLWQFHVNWTTPSLSTFTGPTNIPVAAFSGPCGDIAIVNLQSAGGACIPQTGTTQMLNSYGDRVMYRLAYRNLGSYQSLLINHAINTESSSNNSGIRWYELQNTGSGFTLYQQGTYAPDSNFRWMGSLAMDKMGDIALGYSVSSSTMSPTIRYTGRVPTDPLGTMESEVDVLSAAGISPGSQTSRPNWGDYSSMAIDPSDDCTFWFTSQYEATTGHAIWSTRVASFSFTNCTGTETPSFTVLASPSSQTVNPGGSTTYTVTATPVDGFSGAVGLTVSGCPSNTTCTFSPTSVTLPPAQNSTLTVKTTSTTPTGTYTLTITGTSGSTVQNTSVTLVVTLPTSGWTLVNKASNGGQHATSLTVPTTGTGHLIAFAVMFNGTTSVSSVSDNAGNTYVSAGARSSLSTASIEIWYAANSKAGATVITPTFAGSPTYVLMGEWEVSGLATSGPDAKNTSTGTVASNTPGPAVTTTATGDFVVSIIFAGTTSFSGISSGNDFTNDFTTGGNGWAHITSNASTPGTQQASWSTANPTGKYLASTVAFFAAP